MPQPVIAAEGNHAGPGDDGVANRETGNVARVGGGGVDQLDPREGKQQQARRPRVEPGRIGEAQR